MSFENLQSSALSFDANKRSLQFVKLEDKSIQFIIDAAYKHLTNGLNAIDSFPIKQRKKIIECTYLNNIARSIKPGVIVLGIKDNFNLGKVNILMEVQSCIQKLEEELNISSSENSYYSNFLINMQSFINTYESKTINLYDLRKRLEILGELIVENNLNLKMKDSKSFKDGYFEDIANVLMFKHFVASKSFGENCILTKNALVENKKFWKKILKGKMDTKEFYSLDLQVSASKNTSSSVLNFKDVENYYQFFMESNDIEKYTEALIGALNLIAFKESEIVCDSQFFNDLLDSDSEINYEETENTLKVSIKSVLSKLVKTIFKSCTAKQDNMPKIIQEMLNCLIEDVIMKKDISLNISYDKNYVYFENKKNRLNASRKIVDLFNIIVNEYSIDLYNSYKLANRSVIYKSTILPKNIENIKDSIDDICEYIRMANNIETVKSDKIKIKKW